MNSVADKGLYYPFLCESVISLRCNWRCSGTPLRTPLQSCLMAQCSDLKPIIKSGNRYDTLNYRPIAIMRTVLDLIIFGLIWTIPLLLICILTIILSPPFQMILNQFMICVTFALTSRKPQNPFFSNFNFLAFPFSISQHIPRKFFQN